MLKTKGRYKAQALAIAMVVLVISSLIGISIYSRSTKDKGLVLEERASAEALEVSDVILNKLTQFTVQEVIDGIKESQELAEFNDEEGIVLKENNFEEKSEISNLFESLGIIEGFGSVSGLISPLCPITDGKNEYQVTLKEADEDTFYEIRPGQVWSLPVKNLVNQKSCELNLNFTVRGDARAGFALTKTYCKYDVDGNVTNCKEYDYQDTDNYCFSDGEVICNNSNFLEDNWIKYDLSKKDPITIDIPPSLVETSSEESAGAGSLDLSFNYNLPGVSSSLIYDVAVQFDGNERQILIAGAIYPEHPSPRGIARLNDDGSLDQTFNSGGFGSNSPIKTVVVQDDGKILIGGWFTQYNWVNRGGVARLNSDGTLDPTFNPGGAGANERVMGIDIDEDGKIIIVGYFTRYNGTVRNRVARLNTDGTLDTTFNPGTGANNDAWNVDIQSDGKILVGGWFTYYNGVKVNNLARLNTNGSLDTSFTSGLAVIPWAIKASDNGKILVATTYYNGLHTNGIVRLNSDGSLDPEFYNTVESQQIPEFDRIESIETDSDGKILIVGDFRFGVARLNPDGTLDSSFDPGSGTTGVNSVTIQNDGRILIAGDFSSYNGVLRSDIVRLYHEPQFEDVVVDDYKLNEIRIRAIGNTIGLSYSLSTECPLGFRLYQLRATANCSGVYRGKEVLIPEAKWYSPVFDYVLFNGEGSI